MSNLLFSPSSYLLSLPKELSTVTELESTLYTSKYGTGIAKLHTPTLRAILCYSKLIAASPASEELGALGEQTGKYSVCEYIDSKGKRILVSIAMDSGKVLASVWTPGAIFTKGKVSSYSLNPGKEETGSALFFALLPKFLLDEEFATSFAVFHESAMNGFHDFSAITESIYILCDNVKGQLEQKFTKINIPKTGNIAMFSKLSIEQGIYKPTDTIAGVFTVLNHTAAASGGISSIDRSVFLTKYRLSDTKFSLEERQKIPELPQWYVIPKEAMTICEHIINTRDSSAPVQNIMLRGAAGTGKTELAKAISSALGIPYVSITCSAGTEIQEFRGQILPTTGASLSKRDLPSYMDFKYDPQGSFQMVTGENCDSIEEETLYSKIIASLQEKRTTEDSFEFVESPFVEAMRYGYLCELQEISAIGDPAVLNGINAALDGCQSITLDTGEVIQRHPNTVFIFTANIGYEGSRGINQSIISRMQLVFDIETLSPDDMTTRVANVTGFKDALLLRKMVECTGDLANAAKESGIQDGSVGMRELISWAQSTMITKDPLESAHYTILSSASSDFESRTELLSCIENYF